MDQNHFVINVKKALSLPKTNKNVRCVLKIILMHYKEEIVRNVQNSQCQMKIGQNVSQKIL